MVKLIYEEDNFKRMLMADMTALQQLVDAQKSASLKLPARKGK